MSAGTRTPGSLFVVRQSFPTLRWQVVTVEEAQGRAMRERNEPHVYDTSRQAHAVKARLNGRRRFETPIGRELELEVTWPYGKPTVESNSLRETPFTGRLGFTGSRRGRTEFQRNATESLLERWRPLALVHGACVGADDEMDELAAKLGISRFVFPSTITNTRVPDATLKSRTGSRVLIMQPLPPLQRDQLIAMNSSELLACPSTSNEVLRSGTWATVRAARRIGRRVVIIGP